MRAGCWETVELSPSEIKLDRMERNEDDIGTVVVAIDQLVDQLTGELENPPSVELRIGRGRVVRSYAEPRCPRSSTLGGFSSSPVS